MVKIFQHMSWNLSVTQPCLEAESSHLLQSELLLSLPPLYATERRIPCKEDPCENRVSCAGSLLAWQPLQVWTGARLSPEPALPGSPVALSALPGFQLLMLLSLGLIPPMHNCLQQVKCHLHWCSVVAFAGVCMSPLDMCWIFLQMFFSFSKSEKLSNGKWSSRF